MSGITAEVGHDTGAVDHGYTHGLAGQRQENALRRSPLFMIDGDEQIQGVVVNDESIERPDQELGAFKILAFFAARSGQRQDGVEFVLCHFQSERLLASLLSLCGNNALSSARLQRPRVQMWL